MNDPLPSWIERVLGIEAEAGEGTTWSLDHSWGWPPWVTFLVVVVAVVFAAASYLRENRQAPAWYRMFLAAIRTTLVGIVLVMLAQLVLTLQRTGLPYVAVLLDDSLSMTIVDRYDDSVRKTLQERVRKAGFEPASRWNLARTLLSENGGAVPAAIFERYKLKVYYLTGPRPSPAASPEELLDELRAAEPVGENTRLGAALRAVLDDLRGSPPAAIVIFSDGISTDEPSLTQAAPYARRKGVPLYLVGLGDDKPVRDLRLSDLLVDDVVFVDDVVYFEAKLAATGYAGRQVPVILRRQGHKEVLAKLAVTLGPDGQSQQVRLPYRPTEPGDFRFVLEVEPQEGEIQTENNRQERLVRVRKEKIRVLLVQADPSWEYRFLRNMLARDSTVELKAVLQNADLQHAGQDPAVLRSFPVGRDELFGYDVIILGDANPGLLTPSMVQNIADFVQRPGKGGALICVAGPQFMPLAWRSTPLARLLPIDLGTARYPEPERPLTEGFVLEPTELGLASPAMQLGDTPEQTAEAWKKLAPLYWALEAPDPKPGARVLAERPAGAARSERRLPVILLQYVGAGKVLFHATDETWQWRRGVGDVFFARYWVQTIRYLARSKLAEEDASATLTTDRREHRRGEPVRLRVRFANESLAPAADDGVTAVLEHQGHQTERIPFRRGTAGRGTFEATLGSLAIGSYHAWVAIPTLPGRAPAADFTVVAPPGEFERVQMDSAEMRQAAEMTKGRFYTAATAHRLLEELPEGHQVPIESLPPKPLWNSWPLLLVFLVLLTGEWVLRKARGMV